MTGLLAARLSRGYTRPNPQTQTNLALKAENMGITQETQTEMGQD